MSKIEIPYLPINGFNETDVCSKLEQESHEKTEQMCKFNMKDLRFPERGNMSKDILLVLHGIGMEKYAEVFQENDISLETFLHLNEMDLQELGIDDPNDRKTIADNLLVHQTNIENVIVTENPSEDLIIAKNVLNQLLFLQNYCAYLDIQMKRTQFVDYRLSWKENASDYLRAFIEASIIQSRILSYSLFNENNSDHLIGKIVKAHNLTLPRCWQEKLKSKKKAKKGFIKVMVVIGFCSMILLTRKFFVGTKAATF